MDALDFVLQAERDLLTTAKRASITYLGEVLADDFIEIGQSGTLYDKQDIIAALIASPKTKAHITDLTAKRVTQAFILVHYKTTDLSVSTRPINRHSLWQLTGKKWRLLYHEAAQ